MNKLKWAAALVIGAGLGAVAASVVHARYRGRIVEALEEVKEQAAGLALTLAFGSSPVAADVDEFLVDPDPDKGEVLTRHG